jgi:hypothetical protein
MKTVWVCADEDRFDTYEDAREDASEKMDWDDLANFFQNHVTFVELLKWASKQENFWAEYENDIFQAEDDYFTENYWEEEVEDEEE